MAVAEDVLTLSPASPDALPPEWEACLEDDAPEPQMPAVDPRLGPRLARRRARIEAQRAELEATYRAEVDALTLWRDAQAARLQREADRLDLALLGLLDWERERDPTRKSLPLAYGVTPKTRKVPASIKREDTSAAATAALVVLVESSAPDCIERKPTVRWEKFKETLQTIATPAGVLIATADGEPLPPAVGVVYTPEHQKRWVEVDPKGGASIG